MGRKAQNLNSNNEAILHHGLHISTNTGEKNTEFDDSMQCDKDKQ